MSKNVIIKGTMILTIAGILTKLLGFYNRIFLTRVIGVKELGIYQLIFPIYILVISFCCQGIGTSIIKHVSYYLGKNHKQSAKNVFKLGLILSLTLSSICMVLIYILAEPISIYLLKNSDCGVLLKYISVAFPFVATKCSINAYFIAQENPRVQALSHFTEQLIRILTAFILVYITYDFKTDASLATVCVVSGEIFSGLISIIIILASKNRQSIKYNIFNYTELPNTPPSTIHKLTNDFIKDAIPITANNLIFTLFASLEAILLPAMLFKYYLNSDTAMELYGIITGIVIPFLLFPATITTAISTMLLPAISGAKAHENFRKIKDAIFLCVSLCLILGIITIIGYLLLGEWACEFAFKSADAGIILKKMCVLCPFIYICGILSTILNGLDKAFNNMIINVSGLIIRILFTTLLVPSYGLNAYILGMFICYIYMLSMMSLTIKSALIKNNPKAT